MNPHKYFVSADLISNPLCGIDTYKDILNLETGQTARKIMRLVLMGNEQTWSSTYWSTAYVLYGAPTSTKPIPIPNIGVCSHFVQQNGQILQSGCFNIQYNAESNRVIIGFGKSDIPTLDDFKAYLAQQYAAGTPVTIWYVLASPATEQIAVPSGLSGTLEGLLTQSGTPTTSDPIYPTAVTGEGWYNINTYKRSVLVWNTDTAYERESGAWT